MAYNGDDFDDLCQSNASTDVATSGDAKAGEQESNDLPKSPTQDSGNLVTGSAFSTTKDSDMPDACETDNLDEISVGWLRPLCIAIVAIAIVWVMRMFLPLIQMLLSSKSFSGQWWIYLLMVVVPLLAIGYAAWVSWRTFLALPKGVNCYYKDYVGREDKLRKLLIKDYLSNFKKRRRGLDRQTAEHIEKLCLGKRNDDWLDDDHWIEEYKKFQGNLKKKAEEIKNAAAKKLGTFTVVSQESLLDRIGVLFFSSLMVLNIAKVFNKRMTTIGAMKTTVFWAMNLYLGGKVQNLGRNAASLISGGAGMAVEKLSGSKVLGSIVEKVVKGGGGFVVEYTGNAFLAEKLGDMAIKEFVAVKFP